MTPFKIVALAYMLYAGKPIDEPLVFDLTTQTFSDEDKCNEFLISDDFRRAALPARRPDRSRHPPHPHR